MDGDDVSTDAEVLSENIIYGAQKLEEKLTLANPRLSSNRLLVGTRAVQLPYPHRMLYSENWDT